MTDQKLKSPALAEGVCQQTEEITTRQSGAEGTE